MGESDGPLTGWESDAPLRSAKNVLITPRTGGFCNVYVDLAMPTVEHNLRQFLSGHAVGMANIVRRGGGARARLNTPYLENNDSETQANLRSVFQAAIRAALAASRSPSPSHSSA
jgi:hypothetical protein